MESINFPESNFSVGKGQPQYRILQVCKRDLEGHPGVYEWTAKLKLNEFELAQIAKTGCVFTTQISDRYRPSSVRVESPFFCIVVEYRITAGGNFFAYVKNNAGTEDTFGGYTAAEVIDHILAHYEELSDPNQLFFRERSTMAVGENGLEEEE